MEKSAELTLLEAGLMPVEELAMLASREARRPRPIYQTHKWFARRFGSAFRSLLIGATTPRSSDFWTAYYENDLRGRRVLDPFVGGGTSVIEAQRLGADCYATDIDPVAVAITDFQARLSEFSDLDEHLSKLKLEVGAQLGAYHKTVDSQDVERTVLHHFWVQQVKCGGCSHEFDAHPHFELAHDDKKEQRWVFCKDCGEIHRVPLAWKTFSCKSCHSKTTILEGPVNHGTATCPRCNHTERLIDVSIRTGTAPRWKLFAQEVIDANDSCWRIPVSQRIFKRATENDVDLYLRAEDQLHLLSTVEEKASLYPEREIPTIERTDSRLIKYGYRRYSDLFNSRQLLHHALLLKALKSLPSAIAEPFAFAFSDHLKTNCMLTSYAFGWRRLCPLFSVRAFRHVARPVEINPWIDGTGRGTFPNTVKKVQQAIDWAKSPLEPARSGGFRHLENKGVDEEAIFQVDVRSAKSLSTIEDSTIDIVLTDPPYFDNIAYSELSDFFLPWLKDLEVISAELTSGFPSGRLVGTSRTGDAADAFGLELGRCFAEVLRKLKPRGRIVFTYHHQTSLGWFALAKALAASELGIVYVLPLFGNSASGPHRFNSTITWDAVLVAMHRREAAKMGNVLTRRYSQNAVPKKFVSWNDRLYGKPELRFGTDDSVNLLRAFRVAGYVNSRRNGAAKANWNGLKTSLDAVPGLVQTINSKKKSGTKNGADANNQVAINDTTE